MAQKPPEPQAVPGAKDSPSSHGWLFLFYKWVTSKIDTFTSIFSTVDFVVGTASSELGAERVATDTTSIDVDIGTAGQMKWNLVDEYAQDLVGAMLSDTASINFTYTDATGLITADVLPAGVDHGGLAGLSDDDHTQYYLVNATRGMNGADFNRVAANPGNVDTLWMDDGTSYIAGTLVAEMPAVFLDEVSFGAPGFEQGSITVNGATYDALVKINEYGGTRDATLILHRHHSTNSIAAGLVFAKAGTDDATHSAVADGERLGEIIAVGHDGTDYAQSSAIRFLVDGTPGANDMPGAIVFLTAPDGSQTIAERFRVGPTGEWGIGGENYGTSGQVLTSGGAGAAPSWADAAGASDHGALSGLSDDDHTQYVLNDGTRATTILAAASGDYVRIGGGAAASELRFLEPSGGGTSYAAIKAPALAASYTLTLPANDGDADQVLTTDGSGVLSWATGGGTASEIEGAPAQMIVPGGRLTLTTATPVMSAEAAAQTTIYYTPYLHDQVPLYDGTKWTRNTFTELSIAMAASANWASGSNYDLYVYNDGGTLRLVTGAAWTSDTARNESLTRLNGRYVNAASMTGRYGASSTVTVGQYRGLYVGTMRCSANGTTTWELGGSAAGGDPGFLYVWNCYNRVPVGVAVHDNTDSWTYGTAAWQALNASNSNRISFVRGLNEDFVHGGLCITVAPPATSNAAVAVGLDSTSAIWASAGANVANATGALNAAADALFYSGVPGLGYHFVQAIEYAAAASGVFYGDAGTAYIREIFTFNGMF